MSDVSHTLKQYSMQRFKISIYDSKIIYHNHFPEIKIQVIFNEEDDYEVYEDVYEVSKYNGKKVVIVWVADNGWIKYLEPLGNTEYIEFIKYVHLILRRAWLWYQGQIDKVGFIAGPMENERFILQQHSNGKDWVATDKENLTTIFFEHQNFTESQEIVPLNDIPRDKIPANQKALREMAEWLLHDHRDKVF